jgi:FkbM family methyltransferase
MYAFMRRVLREDSNCVDIGASFGGYLEQMLAIAPRGTHHAFEPIPDLAGDLRHKFPAAKVYAMAVSDTAGMLKFHYFPDVSPFSGLKRRSDVAPDERESVIDVPVVRLDDVLPEDFPVALIKVDVEGGELDALRGAERTLRRWRPHLIIEHDSKPAEIYGATTEMLYAFVAEQCGYAFTTGVRALEGATPFTRDEFVATAREGKVYNFIAIAREL